MPPFRYEDHTDSVEEKLRLLKAAWDSRNHDLAMSLAESLKDTLSWARQEGGDPRPPDLEARSHTRTGDLPGPWAAWAGGWAYCKPVALYEEVGMARAGEPVDLAAGFPADQVADLQREVRVARLEEDGSLREVHSQLYGEARRGGGERVARLVFQADVAAHRRADYLIFYGNPNAELPAYSTDLTVSGEDYGLDIANRHFLARLSRQMGQLERITLAREHGLELYAGGKGHGEPPTIDWAHDYVDGDHYQKLRIKNWARCPNHEVIKGPVCARVRRWGFPHSPLHPIYTPSRVHIDVTYSFYAGLPYFFKQSRIEAVREAMISAMRDDEWVFSGYSFTDPLWIDSQGKVHEGAVPPERQKDLWGAGFFHRTSRDAFVALWLKHEAAGFEGIQHGGPPNLHYPGHGQLWSRYPVESAVLNKGAVFSQRNAYLVSSYPETVGGGAIERLRHQLLHPLEARSESIPRAEEPRSSGALARPGETPESAPLKSALWKALQDIRDEQLYKVDANVIDLGLVYDVRARGGTVEILITMPHRGRPVHHFFAAQGGGRLSEGIRERLLRVEGVREVAVSFTWNPPWTAARLTVRGRRALGLED
ncbi:MAG: metal-sulfur cluster assembly factor [Planctomycetes bacterium]|nr:metal-sulfur cluster assembly factor [Planctomycetota bacterium]